MYCTNCGTVLPEKATRCPSCGHPVYQFSPPPAVSNYLVQSILVTMCCCLPFGIVALVYAAQVNGKIAVGDIAGAQEASRKAKIWSTVGFIAGILLVLVSFVMGLLGGFENF
jgi:uncharacterized membrane protein YvbJ